MAPEAALPQTSNTHRKQRAPSRARLVFSSSFAQGSRQNFFGGSSVNFCCFPGSPGLSVSSGFQLWLHRVHRTRTALKWRLAKPGLTSLHFVGRQQFKNANHIMYLQRATFLLVSIFLLRRGVKRGRVLNRWQFSLQFQSRLDTAFRVPFNLFRHTLAPPRMILKVSQKRPRFFMCKGAH